MGRLYIVNPRRNNEEEVIKKYLLRIAKYTQEIETKPKGKKVKYDRCKHFATFDTETTNVKELKEAYLYAWSFCFRGYVLVGRNIDSLGYFLNLLATTCGDIKLLIYVHNLSFDFASLASVYNFQKTDTFFTDKRKVLYCTMYDVLEFRCSYLLTGLSLHHLTREMKVKHMKKSGERFDYSKERTTYDGLKRKYELEYIINDVLGLEESLIEFFKIENDTTWTISLTKTGFVRRDLKKALAKISYKKRMSWQLDYESYIACEEAFRGGNVHASRFYVDDETISHDCYSNDFASSYPFVMLTSKHFPKRNFTRKGAIRLKDFFYYIDKLDYCGIFRIQMSNVKLKNKYFPCPYLPLAKVRNERFPKGKCCLDNGRILECEYCETTVTDIDLKILMSEYSFKVKIVDSFLSATMELPKEVKEVIMKYFRMKTELKGVSEKEQPGAETMYFNNKTKLNSCYGCLVTSAIKGLLQYNSQAEKPEELFVFDKDIKNVEVQKELLEKYNKKGFLSYAVGVFVTAIARLNLEKMIQLLPNLAYRYSDTDSLKYSGCTPDIFNGWNDQVKKICEEGEYFAFNKKGKKCYLGTFDLEEHMLDLKVLGAKKYCYITDDGELHLTCAGVHKVKGAKELLDNGGIKAFRLGFIFKKGGGTVSYYNDFSDYWITRKGVKIHVTKNIYIEDSEYTLKPFASYEELIESLKEDIYNNPDCGIMK